MCEPTERTPLISVIVPSYRGGPTLGGCLEALLTQNCTEPYEVILVRSGIEGTEGSTVDGDPLPRDERLHVIDFRSSVVPSAIARNHGVASARGQAFAFVDADTVPDADWLRALIDASEGLRCCVGGAVRNGTPDSGAGTALYLAAFLDHHPNRPSRTHWHGATCNLLVPRALWERYGPFAEDMAGGEDTLLTAALHRDRLLRFGREAVVTHLNRTRTRDVLLHQYGYGRFTPRIAVRGPYKMRPLVRYRALAPVAGVGRLFAVTARTFRWAELPPGVAVRALPILVLAMGAWTVGLFREPRGASRGGSSSGPPSIPTTPGRGSVQAPRRGD
ncbi:MAG: hypothetical protein QOC92_3228 [Acidimicrobiaceae bacterium]